MYSLWLYILFAYPLFSLSTSYSFSTQKNLKNHLSNLYSYIPQINMADQVIMADQVEAAAGREFKSIAYFVNWFAKHQVIFIAED